MLTNAIDDWRQGFLYCFFVTVANFPYRERKSPERTWLLETHSSLLLFVVFPCLLPPLFAPSGWTDLGWVGWVCLLMKAKEDRWCRLFVVGVGPKLQRDLWQEKSRLSVIISISQVEHYLCFSINSPLSPDIGVWAKPSPVSMNRNCTCTSLWSRSLLNEVKQNWKWFGK